MDDLVPDESMEPFEALARSEAEVGQLHKALLTSRHIGAAVGIVMVFLDVDYESAFAAVVRLSQTTNTRISDIAEIIVDRRRLPDGM